MIRYIDLNRLAIELLLPVTATEVSVRRSISALYYGLFHRLTAEGASCFGAGGSALTGLASRAFSHSVMNKVCAAYVRARAGSLPPPYDKLGLGTPDPRLVAVASAFVKLQDARHAADYDLATTFTREDGLELLERAEFAHWKLDEVHGDPHTTIFLTALLLADRWTRRG